MRQAGNNDGSTSPSLGAMLFDAIRREGALVQGHPDDGRSTMIDGYLDLSSVARDFLEMYGRLDGN